MSKGFLKNHLSISVLRSFSQNRDFCFLNFYKRTLTSDKKISNIPDPVFHLTESPFFPNENSPSSSFPPEEFSFLRDTLLDSGSESCFKTENFGSGECSNDAFLILNTIRDANDGFGGKTQKLLRQFREKLNENLVVDVLRNVQNVELGVKFFMWAGRQIGYCHSLPVYDALLDLLGCNRNDRIDESVIIDIQNEDKEVLGKFLNVLIQKCCTNGMWNLALEELGRLKDFGHKPSRVTYNALIQVFLKVDKLDSASLVHKEMMNLGFKLDVHTLGLYARYRCKEGKWREALELIEKEEFVPDTVIYTTMISGLCEASLFEEAMNFLNIMRSNSCIPNIITYETLLCGCLKKRKLGRCKRLLKMMITEGCYPRPKIFNSLIHAYCRSGDFSYASKLLTKMVLCGIQPGYVVYNILIGGICGNEELPSLDFLEIAERTYDEMLHRGVVLNKVNVCNFTRCLCRVGKFEKAMNVIRDMMGKGFIPDISTYSKVISFLCNAFKLEKAFFLFKEMRHNGIVPDVYTYTILIDSFCKVGLIQQARSWFDEMTKEGCMPNVVTYTALIHAYLKERKTSDANSLFELMLSNGCMPNVVTFTALIDGHCKAGNVEKACQIYARMMGNKSIIDVDLYFRGSDENTKEVNVLTYGALVDGLCKVHKVNEALHLLDVMSAEGCVPNQIVYDALIDGFCKAGKLDEAQDIYAKMFERGYNPSLHTYSSFIDRLFKDKQLDLAIKVLSKMLENSCAPNVVIYTEMIDGLCKAGKTGEAYKLMLMMEEKGCYPNVVTYTAMIDGYGKGGKLDKCIELFEKMNTKGCAPNYITYTVLVNHLCAAGQLDEAYQLLQEMKKTHWPRQTSSYCKVIEGFNREFIMSLGLLNEISECGETPVLPVYKLLIDSFCRVGRLEVALELHKEISTSTLSACTLTNVYSSLIESLSRSGKLEKAFELYVDMINKGLVPELHIFVDLIKGLIMADKWEDALHLSESLCQMDVDWQPFDNTKGSN